MSTTDSPTETTTETMNVEIWSDVACPWCAIGKARFEQALDAFTARHGDRPVNVTWRSFELDPNQGPSVDRGPGGYAKAIAKKYGRTVEQGQEMIDNMTAQGAADGIHFDFEIAKPGNTFDAHRLIHLAADRGLQHEVKERFMRGYQGEGVPISEHSELKRMAVEVGLDEADVNEVLNSDAYGEAVRRDEAQASAYGISGVPFFVLDGRIGVSGAQPPEVLVGALEQAFVAPAASPIEVVADGDACGIDGCD